MELVGLELTPRRKGLYGSLGGVGLLDFSNLGLVG